MTGLLISYVSIFIGAFLATLACRWTRSDRMRALESELALCRARAQQGVGRPPGGHDGRGAVRAGGRP